MDNFKTIIFDSSKKSWEGRKKRLENGGGTKKKQMEEHFVSN